VALFGGLQAQIRAYLFRGQVTSQVYKPPVSDGLGDQQALGGRPEYPLAQRLLFEVLGMGHRFYLVAAGMIHIERGGYD